MFRKFVAWLSILSAAAISTGCMWTGGLPKSYQNTERYPVIASIHGIKRVKFAEDLRSIVTTYEPTNTITLDTNTVHGWMLEIEPPAEPLQFTEFFILPAPAPRWGEPIPGVISLDRTTACRHGTIPAGAKHLALAWGMAADDPLGNYRLVIFLDDKCAADFNFEVIKAHDPAVPESP